jgi:Zn-dependent metalloprotease
MAEARRVIGKIGRDVRHAAMKVKPRLLGVLLAGGCAATDPTIAVHREEFVDPLTAPLAAATSASRDPIAFKVQHDILVALTGRFPVEGATPVERAERFVAAHIDLFARSRDATPVLKVRRSTVDHLRDRELDVVVLHQEIDGVDVYAGELSIVLEGNEVIAVGGVVLPGALKVGTRPSLTADEAIDKLRAAGIADKPIARPRLAIYDPRVFGLPLRGADRSRLVWQLATTSAYALIDAIDGSVVRLDDGLRPISLQVYDASDDDEQQYDSEDGGCQVASCAGETSAAVDTMKDTYNFYKNGHSWIGYDGDDADHETYINWPVQFATAYQSSIDEEFHFEPGFTTIDIVAHEFTHGVIEHRSDLEYHYESGALNESFADLMGNIVQGENFPGALVGEGTPIGAFRDMCDPSSMGQPEHYDNYANLPGSNDNGGVHVNSGIANFAWCKTAQLLHAKGNSNATARNKMDDTAWLLMGGLPAEATMYITASFAMTDMQTLFGGIGSNPWGHACLVWDAWNQVGVTVNGPLTNQCTGTADSDIDGVGANTDNCPGVPNPSQADTDGDDIGDACDNDLDGDGVLNTSDNCNLYNPSQQDSDNDGIGDACEDMDHDGVDNDDDNCEDVPNAGQEDADDDYIGDACEPDNDDDGVIDDLDNCQFVASSNANDADGDGLGDACDPCPDGADVVIAWTAGLNDPPLNIPPKPILADTDGDGTPDGCDASPSRFQIDGAWASADSALAPGSRATLDGVAVGHRPGEVGKTPAGILIDPCGRRDCRAYHQLVPVWVKVTGAGPELEAVIVDDRGRAQAHMRADGTLQFAPRGGRTYQLIFRSTTGEDVPVKVDVEVGGGEG